ncbi:MAG: peptidase E [Acidobacteria bacterium]|nr:peptidase E [Acidobacteriota bacterium]
MSDIIAIGGGAFSAEPRNLALDKYLLDQAGKARPKVLMIPTATGDNAEYVAKFYAAYAALDARPAHLPFFHRTADLRETVLAQDVVFVGGGNTKSMLALWRDWGLPEILKEASTSGVVLGGVSAGAICWFEQGVTDSWADRLRPLDCMGWLPGSCCPHYDGEVERRPAYHSLLLAGQMCSGYAIDDGVAAHFRNGKLERIVSKREGARAYYVSADGGKIKEEALASTLLPPL